MFVLGLQVAFTCSAASVVRGYMRLSAAAQLCLTATVGIDTAASI